MWDENNWNFWRDGVVNCANKGDIKSTKNLQPKRKWKFCSTFSPYHSLTFALSHSLALGQPRVKSDWKSACVRIDCGDAGRHTMPVAHCSCNSIKLTTIRKCYSMDTSWFSLDSSSSLLHQFYQWDHFSSNTHKIKPLRNPLSHTKRYETIYSLLLLSGVLVTLVFSFLSIFVHLSFRSWPKQQIKCYFIAIKSIAY